MLLFLLLLIFMSTVMTLKNGYAWNHIHPYPGPWSVHFVSLVVFFFLQPKLPCWCIAIRQSVMQKVWVAVLMVNVTANVSLWNKCSWPCLFFFFFNHWNFCQQSCCTGASLPDRIMSEVIRLLVLQILVVKTVARVQSAVAVWVSSSFWSTLLLAIMLVSWCIITEQSVEQRAGAAVFMVWGKGHGKVSLLWWM